MLNNLEDQPGRLQGSKTRPIAENTKSISRPSEEEAFFEYHTLTLFFFKMKHQNGAAVRVFFLCLHALTSESSRYRF